MAGQVVQLALKSGLVGPRALSTIEAQAAAAQAQATADSIAFDVSAVLGAVDNAAASATTATTQAAAAAASASAAAGDRSTVQSLAATVASNKAATDTNAAATAADVVTAAASATLAGQKAADASTYATAAQTYAQQLASMVLFGAGPPSNSLGVNGQVYFDTVAHLVYGPKSGGVWGDGVLFAGVVVTIGPPSNGFGINGQIAFDPVNQMTYGPKSGGVWPAGVSYKGDPGPEPYKPVEIWATATFYEAGPPSSMANHDGSTYQCLVDHTSTVFEDDLAAGKWGLFAEGGATAGLGNSALRDVGTTAGTVAAGDDSRIVGAAQKSANLSDLANAATARTNLGLGDAATKNVGTGAGTVAAGDDSRFTSSVTAARMPALSGDVTSSAGSVATTIANGVVSFAKMATAAIASTTEFLANTASKLVSVQALWASAAPQTLTFASPIAWDMSLGYNAKVTLTGNATFGTPTNAVLGHVYKLQIIQDGTGGRTGSYPAAFDFGAAGIPTLSTGAGKSDFFYLDCYDATPGAPKFRCTFNKAA